MGQGSPQRGLFYHLWLETFVPAEHPLRAIRPLIDDAAIRRAESESVRSIGRPSIPPEQLGEVDRTPRSLVPRKLTRRLRCLRNPR